MGTADTVGAQVSPAWLWVGLLVVALTVVGLWAFRERAAAKASAQWQVCYWHLMATARCPLCGSRMEPEPAPAPGGVDRDAGR
jgi:hypothetical protein